MGLLHPQARSTHHDGKGVGGNLAAGQEPFTFLSQLTSAVFSCPDRPLGNRLRGATPASCTQGDHASTHRAQGSVEAPAHTCAVRAASCAGRLSMKELTEKTARPGPGGP